MKSYPDQGFASTQFLFTLILISSISLGLGLYLNAYSGIENRSREKADAAREIRTIVDRIMADIENPMRPDINSIEDPLWSWRDAVIGDYRVSINPISDRINLNYLGKGLMEQSNIKRLFNLGRDPESLRQYRYEKGFSLSLSAYDQFFSPETLASYFTCYGWANINLIDEFSAEHLALRLTGSEEITTRLRNLIQENRVKKTFITGETLKTNLGMDYQKLFPHINAEPMMNVNFISPAALKTLIAYPPFGVKNPHGKAQEILERRRYNGISREALWEILEIRNDHPLTGYLGVITWFWEITITGKGGNIRAIVCRIPDKQDRYSLIEMREL